MPANRWYPMDKLGLEWQFRHIGSRWLEALRHSISDGPQDPSKLEEQNSAESGKSARKLGLRRPPFRTLFFFLMALDTLIVTNTGTESKHSSASTQNKAYSQLDWMRQSVALSRGGLIVATCHISRHFKTKAHGVIWKHFPGSQITLFGPPFRPEYTQENTVATILSNSTPTQAPRFPRKTIF